MPKMQDLSSTPVSSKLSKNAHLFIIDSKNQLLIYDVKTSKIVFEGTYLKYKINRLVNKYSNENFELNIRQIKNFSLVKDICKIELVFYGYNHSKFEIIVIKIHRFSKISRPRVHFSHSS